LGRSEQAIAVYDQVVGDYGADPATALREQVAKALFNKGVTLGQLRDEKRAMESWQRAIDEYADVSWAVAVAAMSLAALSAVDRLDSARSHLETAQIAGAPLARTCADSLSADHATRAPAREALLAAAADDSDGLNFLGISAFRSGDLEEAKRLWTESLLAGDSVAGLLLTRLPGP
jgi:tetratricopeptide (TPR) repeat protein